MATIPVEKKSGTPWWMWLLPLLLLGALLFYFLGNNEDDPDNVVVDTTTQTTPGAMSDDADMMADSAMADGAMADSAMTDGAGADAMAGADTDAAAGAAAGAAGTSGATGGAITNVDDLYAANLTSMVGRRVEVDNATVLSVTGDSTFYVGAGRRRFLVALSGLGEGAEGPGSAGADGRFNIDVGDRVSIRGTVTPFDATNRAFSRLSEADRTDATTRGAFVNVTRASDITSR